MIGAILLQWRDRNYIETEHLVYRSDTPMDINSLPIPIASLGSNVTEYIDEDVVFGNTYYYRIGAVRGIDIEVSDEYEMVAEVFSNGPGSSDLIAGHEMTGFYGDVYGTDMITYSALSSAVGLGIGTLVNNDESGWLKFSKDNQVIYVAKTLARVNFNWNNAQSVNILYDAPSTKTVVIEGRTYRVTLLSSAEWNRFMYPIHVSDPSNNTWNINYTDTDLNVGIGAPVSYMVDIPTTDRAIVRGGASGGITFSDLYNSGGTGTKRGWRPVLRTIN